jgi:acyl-CoA-dependent ceramide synthase
MFTHHVVTSLLMYVAYAYRWTKIGNVILVIMDVVDVLLPVRKRCADLPPHCVLT